MREPDNFNPGDIIRYGSGSTALARLTRRHAGGWHADQCMGGRTFVSRRTFEPYRLADEEDMVRWKRCAWHRGEEPCPAAKPHLAKEGGVWVVKKKRYFHDKLKGPALVKLHR